MATDSITKAKKNTYGRALRSSSIALTKLISFAMTVAPTATVVRGTMTVAK